MGGSGIDSADFLSGLLSGSGVVSTSGSFSAEHFLSSDLKTEGNETLLIKLYTDAARTKEVASTSVLINDTSITPAPVLTNAFFSLGDLTIAEGGSGNDLLITRSGDLSAAQAVALSSRDGSATAGSDYEPIATSVAFAPGESVARLRIKAIDDTTYETPESFSILGGSITGGPASLISSWSKGTASVSINDNDPLVIGNRPATGSLTIDGKPIRNALLTANPSAITDPDGLGVFSYKWSLKTPSGSVYDLGTDKSLSLTNDMVGKTIKVTASFTDGKGNAEAIASSDLTVRGVDPDILSRITASDWEMYVDRYPLTLGVIYTNLIQPSTGQSKAAFGESHYIANGDREGRILKVTSPADDLNDYGAYVENYGTTLLDVYRSGVAATNPYGDKRSLFEWGKWHYETYGKAEGRDVSGGVDWGAIVRNDSRLLSQFTDAQRADSKLTAFRWGFLNQSSISSTLGKELAVGSALDDTLQGNRVFGQAGSDVVIGSAAADILHGGFGNDVLIGIEQSAAVKDIPGIIPTATSPALPTRPAKDYVYGGPGDDQFVLAKGAWIQIQDFRKGSDVIRLGNYTKAQISLEENLALASPSTDFIDTTTGQTLATVYGQRAGDFTYALASRGMAGVFV